MVIESIAAATAALSAINALIKQANETGEGVHKAMDMISDFGEQLTNFEAQRRQSAFKPLTQSELLNLARLKRQYDRHWQSIHDLLLISDPKLLEDFREAKKQQERDRQTHLKTIALEKKERQRFLNQVAAAVATLLVGGVIITMGFTILFAVYG